MEFPHLLGWGDSFYRKEKNMSFAHLHVHSDYSLLDGLGKIEDIVKKVKKEGMTACAITDHGTGAGLVSFHDACKEQDIKPVLGCEMYEAPTSRFHKKIAKNENHYYHLILLVKNETGYHNLCKLISKSNTEGFYYKPRIDRELLARYHEGLICLSACIAGRIQQDIIRHDLEKAEEDIQWYQNLFGKDFYLEIQNHGLPEESMVTQEFMRLSKQFGIKLVATNDCHYVDFEDREAHDWLLCMQTGKKLEDFDRMRYEGDYSVKSEAEMRSLFPFAPEAIENTMEIVEKCNFNFAYASGYEDYRMPRVVIPQEYGNDYFRYLKDETWKGFENRYPAAYQKREEAMEKTRYELSVIKQMGFAEYFLDTRKTIQYARNHGILVGPGRGSAAGSALCYCIGITDIDPIRYGLLFERFLNPERISMPDIDADYDYSYKDEVITFEAESNGKNRFSKIQTFTTMQAKGILKDCARVAGFPVSTGVTLSKFVGKCNTLQEAWDANPSLQQYIKTDTELSHLWEIALKLEGTKKAASTHACGHIPTLDPCEDLFPCSVDQDSGYLICEYDMVQAEHLGNLKKDLLMLRNLTVIDTAQKAVKERYGIDIPLWTEEILNDPEALALIARGDTNGVFQLESEGMKKFMRELKPSCFEDIIAGVALYRPGPMDFIPDYIKGKHHPETITYLAPELEEILAPTYGQIVYQEQVMMIVRKLAGFSMGRADVVRKAMGKKKMDIMLAERIHFVEGEDTLNIPGCIQNGISKETSETIYDQMVDFAKYAFNKSHAAAYAAISMQTAYLKVHYPMEFFAGLLTSVMDKTEKLTPYLIECKRSGIKVFPPDINTSTENFSVTGTGDGIYYGLSSVKKVGKDVIRKITSEARKKSYSDLYDFIERNPECNSGACQNLVYAGAFDKIGINRHTMAENICPIMNNIRNKKRNTIEEQISLFDLLANDPSIQPYTMKEMTEYSRMELLNKEKDAAGLYISGHPAKCFDKMREIHFTDISSLQEVPEGKQVMIKGMILDKHETFTKKRNKKMCFLKLEDQTGETSVVVFPSAYDLCGEDLKKKRSGIHKRKSSFW